MVSEKQLAANRRNALQSTGPRTPEGKARSARNHTVTGVLSHDSVVPALGETPEAFAAFRDRFFQSAQPANPFEAILLEDFVACQWRLARARRAETGFLDGSCGKEYSDSTAAHPEGFSPDFEQWSEPGRGAARLIAKAVSSKRAARGLANLGRYQSRLRSAAYRALAKVEKGFGNFEPISDGNPLEINRIENAETGEKGEQE